MSPKLKLTAYAVLVLLSAWFAWGFYSNYSVATKPVADLTAEVPAMVPDSSTNTNSNNPANASDATNAPATPDTNSIANSDSNAVPTPDTNATTGASATDTNATTATNTNAVITKAKVLAPARRKTKTVSPPDISAARGSMITYLAAFVGSVIGLGLLIAYDVTQFAGSQAVDFLFNDAGEGQRDPDYERAEAEWANGQFLDAIQLMRDFLKKNPRDLYAALRIAEIYEKDLKNPLASALEYEEVLKHKLPAERWGWSAVHLCNLYSRLNQSDKALTLLRRVADEYPKTGAAKKARARLGIAEPEPEVVEEQEASADAEPEESEENQVIFMEAHPPELEPRQPSARPPQLPTPDKAPERPKPTLPPGFRPKK